MHLMSVDLPAPLSPTSAMTSPAATRKSTSVQRLHGPEALRDPAQLEDGRGASCRAPLRRPSCQIPALVQASAYLPVQTSSVLRKPSLMTVSSMLSFVTATGVSSTDGTWRLPSSDLPLTSPAGGCVPLDSAIASLDGRVGLLLDRLVDRHALVAGEDVLDALRASRPGR